MKRSHILLSLLLPALLLPGCAKKETTETITVWDYYGKEISPIHAVVAEFEKAHPNIKVQIEDLDWETMRTKLNVVMPTSKVPDLITADMTWLPNYAPLGVFADLGQLSGDKLNGSPLADAWAPKAFESMKFDGKVITALYDFDAYALYYRADLVKNLGLAAPKTWDDLVKVGKALTKDGKNHYALPADTFHLSQFIFQNGGALVNGDATKPAFDSPEAKQAIQFFTDLALKDKVGLQWTPDQGDILQGVKDGRVAMFTDGPYRMAQLKTSAPDQSGQWAIVEQPFSKQPGSYLGGTGLVIPAKSTHQQAAWTFAEFLLKPENAIKVYTKAGAAPALLATLERPEINQPDPYFGGQVPMQVFKRVMESSTSFPKIRDWNRVDEGLQATLRHVFQDKQTVDQAVSTEIAKLGTLSAQGK